MRPPRRAQRPTRCKDSRLRTFVGFAVAVSVFAAAMGCLAPVTSAAPLQSIGARPRVPAVSSGYLYAVSCRSTTACFAVGTKEGTNGTLVKRWDGTTWSTVASPDEGLENTLNGVSCVDTTRCVAIGTRALGNAHTPIAERWTSGSPWTLFSPDPPNPGGASGSDRSGVSCDSATSCYAVGTAGSPLVEHSDGTSWSVVPSSSPSTFGGSFGSVSCPSAASCIAVSSYSTGAAIDTLVQDGNAT